MKKTTCVFYAVILFVTITGCKPQADIANVPQSFTVIKGTAQNNNGIDSPGMVLLGDGSSFYSVLETTRTAGIWYRNCDGEDSLLLKGRYYGLQVVGEYLYARNVEDELKKPQFLYRISLLDGTTDVFENEVYFSYVNTDGKLLYRNKNGQYLLADWGETGRELVGLQGSDIIAVSKSFIAFCDNASCTVSICDYSSEPVACMDTPHRVHDLIIRDSLVFAGYYDENNRYIVQVYNVNDNSVQSVEIIGDVHMQRRNDSTVIIEDTDKYVVTFEEYESVIGQGIDVRCFFKLVDDYYLLCLDIDVPKLYLFGDKAVIQYN